MKVELELEEMDKDELYDLIDEYKKKIEEVERQITCLEKEESGYKIEVGDVFLHIDSSLDSLYIIRIKSATYRDPTRDYNIVYGVEIISSNVELGSPTLVNSAMYRDDIMSMYKKIDPEHFKKMCSLFNEYTAERTDLNVKYHELMTEIIKENIQ